MKISILEVIIKPKTSIVKVFPDLEKVLALMQERPHMQEQLSRLLTEGIDIAITVKPKSS